MIDFKRVSAFQLYLLTDTYDRNNEGFNKFDSTQYYIQNLVSIKTSSCKSFLIDS